MHTNSAFRKNLRYSRGVTVEEMWDASIAPCGWSLPLGLGVGLQAGGVANLEVEAALIAPGGVEPAALHRLLYALASIGLVTSSAPGQFALTRRSAIGYRDLHCSMPQPTSISGCLSAPTPTIIGKHPPRRRAHR